MDNDTAEKTVIDVETPIIVNFLDARKNLFDWRYENWNTLAMKYHSTGNREEKVYYIGIIDLSLLSWSDKSSDRTHIIGVANSYISWGVTYHSASQRHENGAIIEDSKSVATRFHFPEQLMKDLLQAKKKKYNYFHVLLEEEVDYHGIHSISLLHKTKLDESNLWKYGIPDKKLWYESSVKKYAELSHQKIRNNVQRMCLVSNNSYNWHK